LLRVVTVKGSGL